MSRDVYVYTFFKKRSKFRHAGLEGKFCHELKEPTDFMQKKKTKTKIILQVATSFPMWNALLGMRFITKNQWLKRWVFLPPQLVVKQPPKILNENPSLRLTGTLCWKYCRYVSG